MRILLNKDDQKFIKNNKKYLQEMFDRWIAGMKNDVFDLDASTPEQRQTRDNYISIIKMFESMLLGINMVSDKKKEKPTNFV